MRIIRLFGYCGAFGVVGNADNSVQSVMRDPIFRGGNADNSGKAEKLCHSTKDRTPRILE